MGLGEPIHLQNKFELNTGMVEQGGGSLSPPLQVFRPRAIIGTDFIKYFLFTQILISFLDFMTDCKSEFLEA